MFWSAFWWYLLVAVLGWLLFPLTYYLFPGLNDRGYAFSRTLGLLLWGYLFWLLSSFGFLVNNLGGYLLALLLLLALVYWALKKHSLIEIAAWVSARKGYLIAIEMLFIVGVCLHGPDASDAAGVSRHRKTNGIGFHQCHHALAEYAASGSVVSRFFDLLLLLWLCDRGDAGKNFLSTCGSSLQFGNFHGLCSLRFRVLWDCVQLIGGFPTQETGRETVSSTAWPSVRAAGQQPGRLFGIFTREGFF